MFSDLDDDARRLFYNYNNMRRVNIYHEVSDIEVLGIFVATNSYGHRLGNEHMTNLKRILDENS